MTVTRSDIAAEAISWVGTPFIWGQSTKGRGCDCKGLIYGVARELGMPEAKAQMADLQTYRKADPEVILSGLESCMMPTRQPDVGDVFVVNIGRPLKPQHMGILVEDGHIVHCYGRSFDKVVRVRLGRSRPIHSWWTWPSLIGENREH